MPHLWNDTWVVTEGELIPAFYNCLKTLQTDISRHKNKSYGIKKVCSGGNGRQLLVAYDSLKSEIRNVIGDPRRQDHLLENFYKTDDAAVEFYTKWRWEDGTYLSLLHQEEYIANANVLMACKRLKDARERERKSKGGSLKGVMATVCRDAQSYLPHMKQKHDVVHTLPSSEKRFKITFKEFFTDGPNYKSLMSGNLRNQRARKVTDTTLELLNDMFADKTSKPTRAEITRVYDGFLQGYVEVINPGTGELYDPKDYKKLSESTIVNYLGAWEDRIGTYAKRSGDRQKLMGAFKPYHSLQQPQFAGSIISVDDRQPPFEYAKGERVWFYCAIDLASEAFTCWVYGRSKEGLITDFYRQLIRNYHEWGFNLPAELEAESSLNSSFTNSFLRPGAMFERVRIEANNARGKRIERYFRDLRYGTEKSNDGWLARPFAQSEANQAGPDKKKLVPYGTIIENSLRNFEDWNNTAHSKTPGKTRWEVFAETQHPDLKPTNWMAILPSLGYATPTSVNTGIMKLQGGEYLLGDHGEIYTGEKLINLMKKVEGKQVTAYWLDDNNSQVLKAVIFIGDMPICEALPKPIYNRATIERTEKDEAAYQMMSKYVATIEGYMHEKMATLKDLVIIDNRPKTLNSKFKINGLKRYEAAEEGYVPEIIETPDEEQTAPVHTTNKSFFKSTNERI